MSVVCEPRRAAVGGYYICPCCRSETLTRADVECEICLTPVAWFRK